MVLCRAGSAVVVTGTPDFGSACLPPFESLVVVAILSAIGIVVFAILLLFGRGLLDLPGVFIGVTGVWISSDNFLL